MGDLSAGHYASIFMLLFFAAVAPDVMKCLRRQLEEARFVALESPDRETPSSRSPGDCIFGPLRVFRRAS